MTFTERTEWVDIEQVTSPQDHLVKVLRDHWWLVNESGQVALYYWGGRVSPQCNQSKAVMDLFIERGTVEGAVGLRQIPMAFVRHRCD